MIDKTTELLNDLIHDAPINMAFPATSSGSGCQKMEIYRDGKLQQVEAYYIDLGVLVINVTDAIDGEKQKNLLDTAFDFPNMDEL